MEMNSLFQDHADEEKRKEYRKYRKKQFKKLFSKTKIKKTKKYKYPELF